MISTKQKKLIKNAYKALEHAIGDRNSYIWNEYLDVIKAEDKQHMRMAFASRGAMTKGVRIEFFAMHTIVQFVAPDKDMSNYVPKIEEYWHLKRSWFGAYALFVEFREHIEQALQSFNLSELVALDYAELEKLPE
jgi:hypothetical protein